MTGYELCVGVALEVALAVEGGGEGHVVEGAGHALAAAVGGHALDAVLGLVGGQLLAQDLGRDVRLQRTTQHGQNTTQHGHNTTRSEHSAVSHVGWSYATGRTQIH